MRYHQAMLTEPGTATQLGEGTVDLFLYNEVNIDAPPSAKLQGYRHQPLGTYDLEPELTLGG